MSFRPSLLLALLALTLGACLGRASTSAPATDPQAGFALAARLGCGGCHEGVPFTPAPRLDGLVLRRPQEALLAALAQHPGVASLPGAELADLRSFVLSGPRLRSPQRERLEAGAVERGRQLYHALGCVACHEPFEAAESLERPLWDYPEVFESRTAAGGAALTRSDERSALREISRRFFRDSLAAYLLDPLTVQPDGRMPDLGLTEDEAADLASYLWYEDGVERGAHFTREPGLVLEYFEGHFPDETVAFDALEPLRREVVTSFYAGLAHADDDYAFRFRGFLEVEQAGEYTFATASDDGSLLYVDGSLVVDNRGQHGMTRQEGRVTLTPGAHALEVNYFEHLGDDGLVVLWEGPGFAERELGPEGLSHHEAVVEPVFHALFNPSGAPRGERLYRSLGCAGCHGGAAPGPALAQLRTGRGCLAEAADDGHPQYDLSRAEHAALTAAIAAGTPPVPEPAARLAAELERLDCGACHAREGLLAGPDRERGAYFRTVGDLDLGDEGRLPPRLDGVGAKLKPAALRAVLLEGARVRPYMRTRMPRFGAANVEPIARLLAEVDAPLLDEREPAFTTEAVEAGRRLAGIKGLGCIQCHDFAGHPSIGIPAVDLANVHERIYPGWFRRLLMDPIALKMNTRMPTFWEDGKSPIDVLDHDPVRQVDALWTYLSLGPSMPLPEGLVPLPNEYEVEVLDRPVSVGVFMKDVSPRTVCVGYPERLNLAYDVQNCRLALAWRGRFLDARGTWFGRAGQLEQPAGENVIAFPRGPAVRREGSYSSEEADRAYRVLGRRIDAEGRPTFRYMWNQTLVEESFLPVLRPGGAGFRRRFALTSPVNETLLVHLQSGADTPRCEITLGEGVEGLQMQSDRFARLRTQARPGASPDGPLEPRTVVYEIEYSW